VKWIFSINDSVSRRHRNSDATFRRLSSWPSIRTGTNEATQQRQVRRLADTLETRSMIENSRMLIPAISAPLDKPDLCVEDLWVAAAPNYPGYMTRIKRNIAPGDTIYLVCDHSNQGGAVVQQWWKTGYYVDGVLVHTTENRDISTGRSRR